MPSSQLRNAFSSAFKIYALLVVELATLRYFFHSLLKVKIGWVFTTDFGLFIPLTVAFFIYWIVLYLENPVRLQLQRRSGLIHLLCLVALIFFTGCFQESGSLSAPIDRSIWFVLIAAVIISFLILFVPATFFTKNKNRWLVIPCALIGMSVPLYEHNYEVLWPLLGKWTGQSVCGLLPNMGIEKAACKINQHAQLVLTAIPYRAILAPGCVGLEGQLFHVLTCLIVALISLDGFRPLRMIFFFFAGAVGIFWINVLRVLILMKLGHWSMIHQGPDSIHTWIRFAFHSHAGWIFYVVYLGFLYGWFPALCAKIQAKLVKGFLTPSSVVTR
jgi:exosortase/archaeosortase family protein